MPDQETLNAIETAELILQVNTVRPVGDPFILPASLTALVTARLSDAKAKNAAVFMIEGATIGASVTRQQSLTRLGELLRNGFRGIEAVPSEDLSAADRAQTFAAYGWEQGKIGDLHSATRIEDLANLAAAATAGPGVPAAGKYAASLVTRIGNWLATLEAATVLANGGDRQTLIAGRNAARGLLEKANARVRYTYCAASDETDFTPELARIGMQPRRLAGEAQPQPLPGAPGVASFDAATRELTVAAMPAHASFLRAYRQAAGGEMVSAGVSATNVVSVVGNSPLTPGVTYTLWVVGENSRGQGPESNKVTFTA